MLRTIAFHIQPSVVADDGTNLTPVQVQPFQLPAADLASLAERWPEMLADLQTRYSQSTTTEEIS